MTISEVGQVVGSTVVVYLALLVLLRLAGRRALAELTVIDLVVVLVLGSAVETAMIRGNISLEAGLVAAATLMVTNRLLAVAMLRSKRFRHEVGGGPTLLVHDGRPVEAHLRRAGLSLDDLHAALRGRGYDDIAKVRFAVFEADGTITAIGYRPAKGTPDAER